MVGGALRSHVDRRGSVGIRLTREMVERLKAWAEELGDAAAERTES